MDKEARPRTLANCNRGGEVAQEINWSAMLVMIGEPTTHDRGESCGYFGDLSERLRKAGRKRERAREKEK